MAASLTTGHSDDFQAVLETTGGRRGVSTRTTIIGGCTMPILLWLLGVPLSLVIILLLFHVI